MYRSVSAIFVEKVLRLKNTGAYKSEKNALKELERCREINSKGFELSEEFIKQGVKTEYYNDMQILKMCRTHNNSDNTAVLYIHGSAYIHEVLKYHIRFCKKLAEKLNVDVYLPIYPLAPNNTYKIAYSHISDFYLQLRQKYKRLIFAGDSAGGGIVLALTALFGKEKINLPDKLIGLSPWVDSCMENTNYDQYEKKDPMLSVPGLQAFAKVWAGDLSPDNPIISPMGANCSGFPPTLLTVGTHECFYPDVVMFYNKLQEEKVECKLIIGEKMNHVWPIYPIKEAKQTFQEIADFIN